MIRSLRSRLIIGTLLGMSALLVAAGVTIYTVLRSQLYRAFDDTLLHSANALSLLIHATPFGYLFDDDGLARLPTGQIRQRAVFQLWSNQPITKLSVPRDEPGPRGPRPDDGRPPGEEPRPGEGPPPGEDFLDDGVPPELRSPGPRSGRPFGGPRREPPEWAQGIQGELVIRSPNLDGVDLPRLDARPGRPRFDNITLPNGTHGRAAGAGYVLSPRPPGPRWLPDADVTVVVAASTAEIEEQLGFLRALLVATALGTMAVSGAVAWLVVSHGLHPLALVAQRIGLLDETGLKQRLVDKGVPREVEPVVRQLNGLLGRLDAAFERERALTADVAHELRTPVAEIRAIADITLGRPREAEEYRQALVEAQEAVRMLQGLIEKLLVLARLEAGQVKPELQAVALAPLVEQQWASVHSRAPSRPLTWENACDPALAVRADARLLEVALSNVLSNAVRYTPEGGVVRVASQSDGPRCRLSVANSGCELSAEQVSRVFDRFWRADTARGPSGLNCGLGLTLVRRAMEAIGGSAEAVVSADRQFILTLTFDVAESWG